LDHRRVKASIIIALVVAASTAAVFVADPLILLLLFYRMQVPPGCVGVLFEDSALNRLPPNASKAIVELFITSPVGDLTEKVTVVVSRSSRSFHKLCTSRDLGEAERKFKEYVDRMKVLTNLSETPVALPTLNIVAYTYSNGFKYVAWEIYSVAKFYREKGFTPPEALKAALRDPFAFLKGSHVVVVRDLKFLAVNSTKVLETVYNAAKERGVNVRAPWEPPRPEDIKEVQYESASILSPIPIAHAQSSCPVFFTTVWNFDLFSSQWDPPQEWYSRIKQQEYAWGAWNIFADRLSKEYWYRSDRFSADEALHITSLNWVGSGFYPMQVFLRKITGWPDLVWINVFPEAYAFTVDVPIGFKHYNPENKDIESDMNFFAFSSIYITRGWAVAGILIRGEEVGVTQIGSAYLPPMKTSGTGFYFIPTVFVYLYDAIIVDLEVYQSSYKGCTYWVVRPSFTLVPHYIAKPVIPAIYAETNVWPSDALRNLTWSATYETVYQDQWWSTIPNGAKLFYEASNKLILCDNLDKLATVLWSVYQALFSGLVSYVLGASPVASFVVSVASALVTYVDELYGRGYYEYQYSVAAMSDVSPPTTLIVSKYVPPLLAEDYVMCRVTPVMLVYFTEIYSMPPSAPPDAQ